MPAAVLGRLLPNSPEIVTNIYVGGGSRESLALDGVDLDIITFKSDAARIVVE